MKIIGYAVNDSIITEADAKKLTHINLAFGLLGLDGSIEVEHLSLLNKIKQIRLWNPKIKIVVSIVPKEADAFTLCAASAELRQKVALASAKLIKENSIDGVDFDWEYPCVPSNGMNCSPSDKYNFTLLCKCIRNEIDTICPRPILSIAAGADLYFTESVELPKLAEILDYICLMTYDLKCGFHALAGHHTQLYSSTGDIFRNSCDQALKLFHNSGVPKEKLILGAAFYSRKWENISNRNNGLLQISKTGGDYGPNFAELKENYIDKNGYKRYWDDEAKAPWLYNGSTFLSYDDEKSLKEKCNYVKNEGYGGIFYWEHSCDTTGTLLSVIANNINN